MMRNFVSRVTRVTRKRQNENKTKTYDKSGTISVETYNSFRVYDANFLFGMIKSVTD